MDNVVSAAQNDATPETVKPVYTAKEFSSGQDVRWCPGCGDFSILAQVQRAFRIQTLA